MMIDSLFLAIVHEIGLLPKVVKNLHRHGFSPAKALRYLYLRVFVSESGLAEEQAFVTPSGVRLRNRREFVLFHYLFLVDEYMSSLWESDMKAQLNPIILDVGANVGFFAALCTHLCPQASIRCFELVPECRPIIERRLQEAKCGDYAVMIAAVGASHGGTIGIRYDSPFCVTNRVEQAVGALQATVPRVSLDGWLRSQADSAVPYLVKIDVEGAEKDVICGGEAVVSAAEYVLLELHEDRDALSPLLATHELIYDRACSSRLWICLLRKRHGSRGGSKC